MELNVDSYQLADMEIRLGKRGADRYTKASYAVRHGIYNEVNSPDYRFQFNLAGEIKYIQGVNDNWTHPAEWLKRTDGNDWVYYSIAGYHRIFDTMGEYYLPCLSYPSNTIWPYNPFAEPRIQDALAAFGQLIPALRGLGNNCLPSTLRNFLDSVISNNSNMLHSKAARLQKIIGGKVTVLPPDTRHVDYDVIPLMISDGCLYQCAFCSIKSNRGYRKRSVRSIFSQIQHLRSFYGANLRNYNALFLGNHDALAAGDRLVCQSAEMAYGAFKFARAYVNPPALFLFGSADSLLNAGDRLFDTLDKGPYQTYINIGLESADPATMTQINKPLDTNKIDDAFHKMLNINRSCLNIEVTANFLMGDKLTPDHYHSLVRLIRTRLKRYYSKGGIYLSPLKSSRNYRNLLRTFFNMKSLSRLPTFLYLIQRL